jgi:hypothetical protein
LTPFQGVQAQTIAFDRNFPNEILVGMNIRDRSKHDVYRINLKNGAVEFDTDNPGNIVVGLLTPNSSAGGHSHHCRRRIRIGVSGNCGQVLGKPAKLGAR